MTRINYAALSNQALKHYVLVNRQDQAAFYAYMERRQARSQLQTIALDDPAWEAKVMALMQAQLTQGNHSEQ